MHAEKPWKDGTHGACPGTHQTSAPRLRVGFDLTRSVSKVVWQRLIPPQNRQLIIHISNSKGGVDGFVGGLTSAKRLETHFV